MYRVMIPIAVVLAMVALWLSGTVKERTMPREHTPYRTLTADNFQRTVLESSQPVLVDFWAAWYGPCRMMAPVIDELAADVAGHATVAKVHIDDYPRLAAQYGIRSIPTRLVFKDGQVVDQAVGVVPTQGLAEKLQARVQPASRADAWAGPCFLGAFFLNPLARIWVYEAQGIPEQQRPFREEGISL